MICKVLCHGTQTALVFNATSIAQQVFAGTLVSLEMRLLSFWPYYLRASCDVLANKVVVKWILTSFLQTLLLACLQCTSILRLTILQERSTIAAGRKRVPLFRHKIRLFCSLESFVRLHISSVVDTNIIYQVVKVFFKVVVFLSFSRMIATCSFFITCLCTGM